MHEDSTFRVLNIDEILPNRFQPRISFKNDSLDELAESISRFGVIEPIVVRPIGNKYEIIAGERRYKASKLASKTTIPSIIVNLTDKESEELALLENVQRQSLNPIEEAVSYKRILNSGTISREELSKKIGKSQSEILSKTKLLNLSDEVQKYLLDGKISEGHAKALLNISNLDEQEEMLHRIVNERLTVKKTNKEIQKMNENNEIESLFDERGKNNMDIDKMMQEAKDINETPETNVPAPDLMAAPNPAEQNAMGTFNQTPQPTEEIPPVEVQSMEQNKFVNNQPAVNTTTEVAPAPEQTATFDNMFNGPMTEPVNTPVEPNINTNEIENAVTAAINNAPVNPALEQPTPEINPTNEIPDTNIVNDPGNATTPNEPVISEVPVNPVPEPAPVEIPAVETPVAPVEVPEVEAPVAPQPIDNGPVPLEEPINTDNALLDETNKVISEVAPANNIAEQPNFAKIIELLRKCGDDIKQMGSFVNIEEVDVGNQYKVIFTIDK